MCRVLDVSKSGFFAWPVAPNLIEQDFQTEQPDRKWGANISCILTAQGWLYLAVVVDLHSRRVVGWPQVTG